MTARPMRTAETERLVLSHFSLERNHPLEDRIRAAGAAGFWGIGLYAGQYRDLMQDGWSAGRVGELLAESNVVMAQVEALSGWGMRQPPDGYLEFERLVWEIVDRFDVPYVQAIGPVEGTPAEVGARFAAMCDRAAAHGAQVGLEFLPFTNIVDAAAALAIVDAAGRPNGGVCVDIWHHVRGADDLEMIRRIPVELIAGVQMSDGPSAPTLPDYKDDCLRHRVPPGAGAFAVDDFVTTILDLGVDLPWDLEVCNEQAWGRPADAHVAACATGMRNVLRRCLAAIPTTMAPTTPNRSKGSDA